jgi:hypothetical protein
VQSHRTPRLLASSLDFRFGLIFGRRKIAETGKAPELARPITSYARVFGVRSDTVDPVRNVLGLIAAAGMIAAGIGASIALARATRRRRPSGDSTVEDDDFESPERDDPMTGCLLLGRGHERFGDAYRVCLTKNQEQKLFRGRRSKLRKLGCGVFACAYESPNKNRVVKFTRDSEDVAALLAAQDTGAVAKVYEAYRLAQNGETVPDRDLAPPFANDVTEVPVYALVVERLRTIPLLERKPVEAELHEIFSKVIKKDLPPERFCATRRGDGCSEVQIGVLSAYERLSDAGIVWKDIHAGNIGYDKKGNLKVLDLGLTKTRLKQEDVKVLEGRLSAARAKLAHLPRG